MSRVGRAVKELFRTSESNSEKRSDASVLNDYFPLLSGVSTGSVNYKTALKLSAVFNATDIISNDIAKIPFGVFEDKNGNKERLKSHPSDYLLSSEPNYLMTPFVFKKTLGLSLMLRGNALFKIIRDNSGNPTSFEYINWDLVYDIREKNGELLYFINGLKTPLMSFEVLHFKQYVLNGVVGVSSITYGAIQMGLSLSVQDFSVTNFNAKGVRQGVIETDKQIPTGKANIIQGWRNAMAEKSAERVVVLDDGLKFKPITITPQELQIIEQSRFNIEDIARWFNIAPHKIKSLQQSTNNNIEQQTLDHASDTIQPLVTNIEQEFEKKLLTLTERTVNGCFIKGNMNVLLRSDIKSRAEWYSKLVNAGIYNRNEVRQLEDMNNGPDLLNEFLTPVNTFTEKQIENNLKQSSNGN